MFGQNPIRPRTTDPLNLAVEEMFYTIQGEGPFSGMPAFFIRLAGCNLACHFCDTQFETQADKTVHVGELLADIIDLTSKKHERKLVVITGGEPMRQPLHELVHRLLRIGTEHIQIETAGTLWEPQLEQYIKSGHLTIVCSPKTPKLAAGILEHCHHWKYIIRAQETAQDGLPDRGTQIRNYGAEQVLARPPGHLVEDGRVLQQCREGDTVWVSPCDEHDEAKTKENIQLVRYVSMKHGYRVSLQTHKILGVA